jgi:hypothetical protein
MGFSPGGHAKGALLQGSCGLGKGAISGCALEALSQKASAKARVRLNISSDDEAEHAQQKDNDEAAVQLQAPRKRLMTRMAAAAR